MTFETIIFVNALVYTKFKVQYFLQRLYRNIPDVSCDPEKHEQISKNRSSYAWVVLLQQNKISQETYSLSSVLKN